jgi:hypothetical protein
MAQSATLSAVRRVAVLALLSMPMLLLGAWLYAPYCETGPVLCVWRLTLGWECPGCGLTRALCHFARGDLSGAWGCNRLIFPALAVGSWVWIRSIWSGLRDQD